MQYEKTDTALHHAVATSEQSAAEADNLQDGTLVPGCLDDSIPANLDNFTQPHIPVHSLYV